MQSVILTIISATAGIYNNNINTVSVYGVYAVAQDIR
jgi:hypothetical protein